MAKITYTPTDTQDSLAGCQVFGHTFFPGQAVDSSDTPLSDEQVATLAANPQFTVVEKASRKAAAAEAPTEG